MTLEHSGVAGMKWHRWRSRSAKYAHGMIGRRDKPDGKDARNYSDDYKRYKSIRSKRISELSKADLDFAVAYRKSLAEYKKKPSKIDKVKKSLDAITGLGKSALSIYQTISAVRSKLPKSKSSSNSELVRKLESMEDKTVPIKIKYKKHKG